MPVPSSQLQTSSRGPTPLPCGPTGMCTHLLLLASGLLLHPLNPLRNAGTRTRQHPHIAACDDGGGNTLAAHALKKHAGVKGAEYNPEWEPDGIEGGVDTHALPWIPLVTMPGCSFKPLRASRETGHFTIVVRQPKGVTQPRQVLLGAQDMFILSGKLSYGAGPMKGEVGPGVWGYAPAGAAIEGVAAVEDTEYLATYYGGAAFLDGKGAVSGLLTGVDVMAAAYKRGVPLVPLSLEDAMGEKPTPYAGSAEPLACDDSQAAWDRVAKAEVPIVEKLTNPHWVDTNALPWICNPEAPDIALKIMRISSETGTVSMIVRQNGQAPPHYHLGPADFFVTHGRIGYRAGPAEGFGPGTYFWEPAGARHEATQRVTDEDLIYTSNVYGPIQFDSGIGTPVELVQSWMQYLEAAKAFNSPLLASTWPNDATTLLAPAM